MVGLCYHSWANKELGCAPAGGQRRGGGQKGGLAESLFTKKLRFNTIQDVLTPMGMGPVTVVAEPIYALS